ERALVRPDVRAELEVVETELLAELAPQRRLILLALLDSAARRPPPRLERHRVSVLHEQDAIPRVEQDGAHGASRLRPQPAAPGVVRNAAFVIPNPSSSSENCSCGSSRRGVKPASWSSCQKSLRGFAKCAACAADTRPGLIPQKTQANPGPSTSGTSLLNLE